MLGVFFAQNYSLGLTQLAPGDRLCLFADGMTEACNRMARNSESAPPNSCWKNTAPDKLRAKIHQVLVFATVLSICPASPIAQCKEESNPPKKVQRTEPSPD